MKMLSPEEREHLVDRPCCCAPGERERRDALSADVREKMWNQFEEYGRATHPQCDICNHPARTVTPDGRKALRIAALIDTLI